MFWKYFYKKIINWTQRCCSRCDMYTRKQYVSWYNYDQIIWFDLIKNWQFFLENHYASLFFFFLIELIKHILQEDGYMFERYCDAIYSRRNVLQIYLQMGNCPDWIWMISTKNIINSLILYLIWKRKEAIFILMKWAWKYWFGMLPKKSAKEEKSASLIII